MQKIFFIPGLSLCLIRFRFIRFFTYIITMRNKRDKKYTWETYSKSALRNQQQKTNTVSQIHSVPDHIKYPFFNINGVLLKGKHKGKKLTEVPIDYLIWMVDNVSLTPNQLHTLSLLI